MPTLKLTGAIALLSAVVASACAGSSSSLPTSPSAVSSFGAAQISAISSSDSSALDATTTGLEVSSGFGNGHGNGNGNGNGNPNANGGGGNGNGSGNGNPNGNGNGNGPPAAQGPGAPVPKKVELEGLISAIAGSVLTVNGRDVAVPATVVVHHGSHAVDFADLNVGDRVHVRATEVSGVLTATDVKLQNPGDEDEGGGSELVIDGLIAGLGDVALCPVVSFTIGSTLVHVTGATVFVNGTCAGLVNGSHVKATGTLQPDTSFLATQVEVVP